MKTVFVSYAHADKLSCDFILSQLHRTLKDEITIWIDDRLVEGELFSASLKCKVQTSDGYLILVSQKYLKSGFINGHEWPWIKEQLENHDKKLFWLPEDVNPDVNAESGILKYLSERQTAHSTYESFAQLRAKDPKTNAYVNHAILGLIDRMRAWANTIDNPNKVGTKAKLEFNDIELQSIRANYLSAIQSLYSHIQTRNLNGRDDNEPIIRLPLDEVYITLQADPTSFQEHSETKTLFLEMAIDETSVEDPKNLQNQLAKIMALPDFVGSYLCVVLELYIYSKTAAYNTLILMKCK
ncbi:MAG: toll/interleukin-1 receptor domain-containing protein [Methylococcaceae bacterium]|nr:toll/interleukin-1 receptor domain-containing protein [Methylococcaceae bacterium]